MEDESGQPTYIPDYSILRLLLLLMLLAIIVYWTVL